MPKDIEENALFIADAHYPHYGDEFLNILKDLESGKLTTPQLFLMGDIFDLLFGYNKYIKTFSEEAIALLQELSKKIEIHYLEGNHDFCLKEIFPNIKIYSREEQPIRFKLNNQTVYLAHGDLHKTGFGYDLYCKVLRNKTTLTLLRPFEKQIIDHRIKKLKTKNICRDFIGYQKRFDAIIKQYPKGSLIIEGHFHQGVVHKNYISLPSLACQREVGMVINGELILIIL
ncbi:UDP-2,3-diacylglucosamine diphosphatase [Sulfurovum sp. bin170]|uniref:UDP-2,3-diacylglucosamine diphosphatase n=1 Tax=Sulfurovum sp. bin170 TaxID=2695268 RepID=UPI0013DFDC0E|nr:metallophosphoesterase [Sulfurovum sp. bin170]NEW61335.1 UDP-2,3-diacylglucosamine diphosphatase [Sulfurovum sp. bin170]